MPVAHACHVGNMMQHDAGSFGCPCPWFLTHFPPHAALSPDCAGGLQPGSLRGVVGAPGVGAGRAGRGGGRQPVGGQGGRWRRCGRQGREWEHDRGRLE